MIYEGSAEPRLQTKVRQLGLESYIRHTKGWLKLIIYRERLITCLWDHYCQYL